MPRPLLLQDGYSKMRFQLHHINSTSIQKDLGDYWDSLPPESRESAFYDSPEVLRKEFMAMSQAPYIQMFLVLDIEDSRYMGHVMLTDFRGRGAFGHESVHPAYRGKLAIQAGKEVLQQLLLPMGREQSHLDWIMGLTPTVYRAAKLYARKIGYRPILELKNACYFYKENQFYDGQVFLATPEDIL